MVTLAGTVATAGLELPRLTRAPPLGAPLVNVTVPWAVLPPTTEDGFTLTAERLAVAGGDALGMTVRVADCVALPKTPVMVTGVVVETENVVTVKLAKPWPAGTLTIGGTRAADALLVASVTDAPPAGALAFRNTVPETLVPPVTSLTLSVTDCSAGGAFGSGPRLMNADFVTPPALASMRTDAAVLTGLVLIVKLSALFPAAMETLAGTLTRTGSLLLSVTTPPSGPGAGMTSPTVPRIEVPPITPVDGFTPSARRVGTLGGPGSISSSSACMTPVVLYVA